MTIHTTLRWLPGARARAELAALRAQYDDLTRRVAAIEGGIDDIAQRTARPPQHSRRTAALLRAAELGVEVLRGGAA